MVGEGAEGGPSFFRKPTPPSTPSHLRPSLPPPPPPPAQPPLPTAAGGSTPGPEPSRASAVRRPVFHGRGGTLFGIHVVNVLLTIVTVGIYYFWAKTRVRAYLASQSEFEGDRFAYHGTAGELLLGTIKAVLVFGVPILILQAVRDVLDVPPAVRGLAALLVAVLAYAFFPIAMVGARRYRLSRTSWRGIRFSFRGRVAELLKIFLVGSLLTAVTFGLYYPFFLVSRQAFLVSYSYFGNERFDFTGRGRDLFSAFVVAILLTLPTLCLCWIWYVAFKRRYFWRHTSFSTARFACTVNGFALLKLWLVNALLLIATIGLAWPWVRVRNIDFAFRNLALVGPLDFERIRQEAQQAGSIGEGLSGFFDSGFDLA